MNSAGTVSSRRHELDLITVAGTAALAYALSTQLHEAGGHGLACLAVGGRWTQWGAFYVDCDSAAAGPLATRIVEAAGSTLNLITGIIALIALRQASPTRPVMRLFLWLMLCLNLLEWAGYFLFSGVSGLGDWGTDGVFKGAPPEWPWRLGLTAVGAVLYVASVVFSARELGRLTQADPAARRRAFAFCWTAYLTGGLVAVLTGLLNPQGMVIVLTSAAASSLGGTSGLMWLPTCLGRTSRIHPGAPQTLSAPRSWAWVLAGLLVAGAVAAVLGPTMTLDWRL